MDLELTQQQISVVVEEYTRHVSEQDVLRFLKMVTTNRHHQLDHTELVRKYMRLVEKECCLPKGYFK